MLKKSLIVVAVVLMANVALGWDYGLPGESMKDPADPNKTIINKTGFSWTDTVDWQYDGANSERKAESWNWPATYDEVPICVIPVQMDVGFWIKVHGCKDLKIKVKQVDIHTYKGNTDFYVTANVATKWSASWTKTFNDFSSDSPGFSFLSSTMNAGENMKNNVEITFKNVNLMKLPAGQNCLEIGKVTLKVRPNVKPNLIMSGCSGSYPQYAPIAIP